MTPFVFRPLPVWPYQSTRNRRSASTFRAGWVNTTELLQAEVEYLGGHQRIIQAGFGESEIRLDGLPYANARTPVHPGVIVSFESKHGPLQYATDEHALWQHNVRAIALALKALRAVDRYGVSKSGQQYAGWKQLTAGSGITSRGNARALLTKLSGVNFQNLIASPPDLQAAYRKALFVSHPDHGGTTDQFAAVQDAGRLLNVRGR